MSNRLDKEREAKLQPLRIEKAYNELVKIGKAPVVLDTVIIFEHNGKPVNFFPYSGWHSGSTIKDGRGLAKLLKQLK